MIVYSYHIGDTKKGKLTFTTNEKLIFRSMQMITF